MLLGLTNTCKSYGALISKYFLFTLKSVGKDGFYDKV